MKAQSGCAFVDIEDLDHLVLDASEDEPLFVSLGSYCEPAHTLRFGDLRKAAFPFDWIVSLDGNALIDMLNEDFALFFNEELIAPYAEAGHLRHTYYHVEFLHEGDFGGCDFGENWRKLKEKYQRRIERFRKLEEYKGKVFFIRSSFEHSHTDPNRYYHFEDNREISEEYALRLYETLKNRFLNLNFNLIIINQLDREGVETRKLTDAIIEIKIYSYPDILDRRKVLSDCFKLI
jgi:hypothetical protein